MLLKVKVTANSRRPGLVKLERDILYVKVSAPPVDGRANQELCDLLANVLKLSPTGVVVKRGHSAKMKYVEITPFDADRVFAILSQQIS